MATKFMLSVHKMKTDELKQFQLKAARIATRVTKLILNSNFYREIGWETLAEKENKLTNANKFK